MTFVNDEEYVIGATFRQEVIKRIDPGNEAEIALDSLPGRTLSATVSVIDRDIAQGQVVASGRIVDTTRVPHGFVFVNFELTDDEGLDLAAGEAGAAAIYTDGGRPFIPVRKVFFRWYTWMNYFITEMDMRGRRQP
jgi:multidrug resistance efflux pump